MDNKMGFSFLTQSVGQHYQLVELVTNGIPISVVMHEKITINGRSRSRILQLGCIWDTGLQFISNNRVEMLWIENA